MQTASIPGSLFLKKGKMYADRAIGASTCRRLQLRLIMWWNEVIDHCPSFGYYPNTSSYVYMSFGETRMYVKILLEKYLQTQMYT